MVVRLSFSLRGIALALVAICAIAVCAVPTPAADSSGESGGVNHRHHALTNAQRFAAGLPPAKPKRLVNHPSKVRHHGAAAASASASPAPSTTVSVGRKRSNTGPYFSGIISVLDAREGNTIGYLSRTFTPQGHYLLCTDPTLALEVSFRSERRHQFSIRAMAPQDEDMPFVGAITANANRYPVERIAAGSPNYAILGLTAKSAPTGTLESQPNQFSTIAQKTESPIWNFDSSTDMLQPRWINADSQPLSSTKSVYLPRNGTLGLVGDSVMHQNLYGDNARLVNFKFIHDA